MTHTDVQIWIDNYADAWRSPGTTKLENIFTSNINYKISPWKQPLHGLRELKSFWEEARSGHNEAFELKSEIVALEDKTAVARIDVKYEHDNPRQWRDLWIIKFNSDGLCNHFEEWPFHPDQDDGHNDKI